MDPLIARLQQGDEDAFEEFVSQYENNIYNLAYRQLGSPQDAQDAAQEVFLRVYRSIARFRADAKLSTWIYQITLNVCIDIARRRSRRPEVSMVYTNEDGEEIMRDMPDETYAPEPLFERHELGAQISACLQELSDDHRIIITLRDINGLAYTEISEVLGVTEGTVKSRLFRARDKLCSILRERGNIGALSSSKQSKER